MNWTPSHLQLAHIFDLTMSFPTPTHPSLSPSMEAVAVEGPLVFVSTYSDFSSLAHRPSGIESGTYRRPFESKRWLGSGISQHANHFVPIPVAIHLRECDTCFLVAAS